MLTIRKLAQAFRRQYSLIIGALSLVIVLIGAIAAFTAYLKATQIDNSARAARSLATMLADETDRSIQSVSLIIARVAARLEAAGVDTPSSLEQAAGAVEFRAFLNDRVAEDASLDTIYVVSATEPAFAREASRRTIMAIHAWDQVRALRDAGPDGIYLSSPFRSRATGAWQLSLTKRVSSKNGDFLGVVSGVINLSSFSDLLGKLALGEHASLSVIRDDGEIIACFPTRELSLGSELARTPLFTNFISQKRDGMTRQVSDVDRLERMFAVVNSDKFPVASVVAVAMNDVLAAWRFQAQALELGAAVIAAVILLGAVLLAMRVEQLAEAREREAVQAQAAVQYARFNNAMDNIVQGLAMYNRNGGLIVCNRRYAEIYGLPLDLANRRVKTGAPSAASDPSRFGEPIERPRKDRDGSVLVLSKLPDGRLIAQRKKALADGGWVSTHEDVTAHREAEDKIKVMATHDALTGLLNRFGFKQRLEQCLAEAQRRTGRFALLYLDLDRFKRVNDTLGHPVGDRLLQAVAARMTGVVRKSDATARLGGDEFAVIQRISVAPRDAMRLAERLVAALAAPYDIDGVRIEIGTSIGIALTPDDSVDADDILRLADLALYHSKADRGSYHFFQTEMDQEFRSKRQLEDDLKAALAEGQFEVHFQPIVSVVDRRVTAFEALLRWNHPVRGAVPERVHPGGGRDRAHRRDRRVGHASGLQGGDKMAPADRRRRQRVRDPVPNAGFLANRFRCAQVYGTARFKADRRTDRKRDDERRRCDGCDARDHPGKRRSHLYGRLRNRLFEPELHAPITVRQDQNRQDVHRRTRRAGRHHGDRARRGRSGASARDADGRGGDRDGRAAGARARRGHHGGPRLPDRAAHAGPTGVGAARRRTRRG